MIIMREFKLIGGRTDWQYVSSVEKYSRGILIGYDSKPCYALHLGYNLQRQVIVQLKAIGVNYKTIEGE